MKIFYGIAGEGLGHATRSRPLLQYLLKHHSVRIFAGGKALHYLKSWFPVCKVESMRLKYSGNRMSALKTIIHNLSVAPLFFLSFLKVFLECLLHRPNVVITDFEPWCAWSALLLRIPLISIQLPGHYLPPQPFLRNKQSIASTGLKHRSLWCRLTLWFVTTITVPYADKVIIPSFFRVPVTDKRAVYVEPVVRDEIRKRKNTAGNHVIVYQTSGTYTKLIHVLKKFPEQNFIIYGFNKVSSENNLFFK
ncbi:hypothetical protein HY484_00980, partial [Candidatus Woesearchaeota archaeon]|nr:hypothetical protein [Candidatus Woesearchaeota archaeon]